MANTVIEGPFTIGDDWVFTFTLQRNSAGVNVTGATVTCSIWRWADETEVDADNSVTLTTPASGIVTLTISRTDSAGYKPGTHYGDVKVVYSGGTIEHFAQYFQFEVISALT